MFSLSHLFSKKSVVPTEQPPQSYPDFNVSEFFRQEFLSKKGNDGLPKKGEERRKVELTKEEVYHAIQILDYEAEKACISHLREKYSTLTYEQARRLVYLIFNNNFKERLPNHFGIIFHSQCKKFGQPFIWLLDELETGGVRYVWRNNIWQIHWNVTRRENGVDKNDKTFVKYLLTAGPYDQEGQRLWEDHRLIFWSYSAFTFQYPFPEDADLSMMGHDFIDELKLAPTPR